MIQTSQTRLKARLDILRDILRGAGHASEEYINGFADGFEDFIAPGPHSHGYWMGVAAGEKFRAEIEREGASP